LIERGRDGEYILWGNAQEITKILDYLVAEEMQRIKNQEIVGSSGIGKYGYSFSVQELTGHIDSLFAGELQRKELSFKELICIKNKEIMENLYTYESLRNKEIFVESKHVGKGGRARNRSFYKRNKK